MPLPNRTGPRASALATAVLAATAAALGGVMLLSGCAGSARADDKAPAKGLKEIQGTWVSDDPIESKWTFEGETLKASVNGMDYTCKVKVDPKASPATIDFQIDEGPEEAKGMTSKCIYKLEDGKLILCVAMPGKDRPKEFETVEDESFLFELTKENPNGKEEKKND